MYHISMDESQDTYDHVSFIDTSIQLEYIFHINKGENNNQEEDSLGRGIYTNQDTSIYK